MGIMDIVFTMNVTNNLFMVIDTYWELTDI